MIIEIAYSLLAVALIIFVIYLTITVKNLGEKAGKMLDETENTIKVLTSDVNVTLHQTNDLLAKVNVLTDDINQKVATIDPLFTAVADLSESVSDLNVQARSLSKKAVSAGKEPSKLQLVCLLCVLLQNCLKNKKEGLPWENFHHYYWVPLQVQQLPIF